MEEEEEVMEEVAEKRPSEAKASAAMGKAPFTCTLNELKHK